MKRNQNPSLNLPFFFEFDATSPSNIPKGAYKLHWSQISTLCQAPLKKLENEISGITFIDLGSCKTITFKLTNDSFQYMLVCFMNGVWIAETPSKNENLWPASKNNNKTQIVINQLWSSDSSDEFEQIIENEFPNKPAYQVLLVLLFAQNVVLLQSQRKLVTFIPNTST